MVVLSQDVTYLYAGDVCSGVILIEAALKKTEQIVDPRQTELGTLTDRAYQLFGTLSDEDKAKVWALLYSLHAGEVTLYIWWLPSMLIWKSNFDGKIFLQVIPKALA